MDEPEGRVLIGQHGALEAFPDGCQGTLPWHDDFTVLGLYLGLRLDSR